MFYIFLFGQFTTVTCANCTFQTTILKSHSHSTSLFNFFITLPYSRSGNKVIKNQPDQYNDYDKSKDIQNQSFIQFRIVSFKYHVLATFFMIFSNSFIAWIVIQYIKVKESEKHFEIVTFIHCNFKLFFWESLQGHYI